MIKIDLGPQPFDFTPIGARRAKVVETRGAFGRARRLRWYVGGRRYRQLAVTPANVALTREWLANAGAADNRPQPWALFD